jgi:hypothetical protein
MGKKKGLSKCGDLKRDGPQYEKGGSELKIGADPWLEDGSVHGLR